MPALKSKLDDQSRCLDARPDRYDVRDRKYLPRLMNLPEVHPAPELVAEMLPLYQSLVLDQGSEGACTGFGLAAMINYLQFKELFLKEGGRVGKRRGEVRPPASVSPRMLYEHARLYDEWPGEDYAGSSCRGAMKGWHRHGVCLEKTWPYGSARKKGRPLPGWEAEAARITLGAYFRVETDDITAIQSAIFEVGAVYVSADVHDGWGVEEKCAHLPEIEWSSGMKARGGHAFALVGFDAKGFIIQNSWGPDWGWHGFARLSYEDWLAHATDAWVATLGVPRPGFAAPTHVSSESFARVAGMAAQGKAGVGAAGLVTTAVWSEDEARGHALVMGNDGVLLRSSAAFEADAFVHEVLMKKVEDWMKQTGGKHLAIYAHGGLNDEAAAIERVRVMGPCFRSNGIFPIFIVWKTGWQESLIDMAADVLAKLKPGAPSQRSGGLFDWIAEKVGDGWDYTVETALGFLGKSLWRQMKQNARSGADEGHGARVLARALVDLKGRVSSTKIHLVGHSAGSIWGGEFLSAIGEESKGRLDIASCHLFAAACTVAFANEHYVPAIKKGRIPSDHFWIHNLAEGAERADNVAGFYRKSLLYFVSRACEEAHKTPLLGMEAAWNKKLDSEHDVFHADFASDLAKWRRFVGEASLPDPILIRRDQAVDDGSQKKPPSHGGFDNDIVVIKRTLNRILGKPENSALDSPVTSLAGF